MATKDEQNQVKIEKFTRDLRCEIPPEVLATKADRLAHLISDVQEKEAEMKNAKKHAQAQIDESQAEANKLANELRDKATYSPVSCERRYNWRLGKVEEVRMDTGAVISERPMSDSERQMELPAPKKTNGKTDKAKDGAESNADSGIVDDDYDPTKASVENEDEPPSTPNDKPVRRRRGKGGEQQTEA